MFVEISKGDSLPMQCELCGRETSDCKPALIDGVKMMVCNRCLQHGKALSVESKKSASDVRKAMEQRAMRSRKPDVYEKMEKVLVSDWNTRIRKARKANNLSREELGFRVGERTVTISKIENGDLRPSDDVVKKLEKELDISLMEEVKAAPSHAKSSSGRGLTLGDLLKSKKNNE